MSEKQFGANLVVDSLINHKVKYVFGIPGAKIDRIFDLLENEEGPQMVVTRHEQGAAFMAQAVGRLTGEPGVVVVTSGPGVSNLATPLLTATSEGDAILAIGGQVKRSDRLKRAHQSMDNAGMMQSATKYSAEVLDPDTLSESIANAYRIAKSGHPGATFLSIPQDVTDAEVSIKAIQPLS
ncbi:acetolactate synthase AlsS, partial [Lactococcus lactis]|nr:acetolactate synthase AlsS [Lactococcus lactis]